MSDKYDHLEEERKKLWQTVRELETRLDELLKSTPFDLQREARGALNKASEYCNRINERKLEAENILQGMTTLSANMEATLTDLTARIDILKSEYETVNIQLPKITEAYNAVIDSNAKWPERIKNLDQNYATSENWLTKSKTKFDEIQQTASSCDGILKKINGLLSQSSERKQEISEVYDEIFGYDVHDDETDEKRHEAGLRSELDTAYNRLENQIKEFSKGLDEFKSRKESDYDQFLVRKQDEHDALQNRIKELLPDALTAGLSHAYAKQCTEEKEERRKSLIAFYWAIGIMTAFAAVPFILGLVFRYKLDKSWEDIVGYLPQLACVMLPLYLPMFWVAFSASRKANLSKRLIEEYAHKETLSKTFQGLEEQISNLENSDTAMELKIRLLYNLVSVSAENPGKLIPNYHKADNPFMEFLDKSIALSESLEKLKNIPGANLIAERILAKQEAKREQVAQSALNATHSEKDDL